MSSSTSSKMSSGEESFPKGILHPEPETPGKKTRRQSLVEHGHDVSHTLHKGFSFFSSKFASQRKQLALKFAMNYIIMAVGILGIFSIYWGSFFNIDGRVKNMRNLVVIEDDVTIDGIPPVFGQTLVDVLTSPDGSSRGDWNIYNVTEFKKMADKNNRTVLEEISSQIHNELYWTSLYIPANATYNYYNAVMERNADYNISGNGVIAIYESARHSFGMSIWGIPALQRVERLWLLTQRTMAGKIFGNTTMNATAQFELISTPLQFLIVDNVQYNLSIYVGPFHDGVIYLTIVSLFALEFFGASYVAVAQSGIKRMHFLLFRYFGSVVSFLYMSLFYCLVTLAFQIDFTRSYGRGGFVVYWMFTFLDMWALGAINEIVAMCLSLLYPPLNQLWVIFIIVINITPTFTPMSLLPKFFRYGYALPSHNYYEAIKTVFFKVTRRQLGRNIGILVAWFGALSLVYPFVVLFYYSTLQRREAEKACQIIDANAKQTFATPSGHPHDEKDHA
ncbi:hypothetical protein G210_3573 [Candida maltosa Xu316]|uniref:DUF3533 domain-containing protein n=1 Tax=Candida maltosa (strain Xu316) TaxID=1245528 RepID=M3J2U0_CANMX|nr:hypothetical protein G210_3573 [Candida maltosa Xu316]